MLCRQSQSKVKLKDIRGAKLLFQGEQIVKAHPCPDGRSNPFFFFFDATHISVLVAGAQAHSVIQRKSVQMDSPEGIA